MLENRPRTHQHSIKHQTANEILRGDSTRLDQDLLARDRQEIRGMYRPPGPRLGTALASHGSATRGDVKVVCSQNLILTSQM